MSTPAQRSARAALDAARPAVARLDATRGGEDLAADLIDVGNAVESALRTLVGSTSLSGQALIREARQRQMIDFDQANALAEFEAVHARLQDTSYRPHDGDASSARNAFLKLDAALLEDPVAAAPRPAPGAASAASAASVAPTEPIVVSPARRGMPMWAKAAIGVVILVAIAGGAYAMLSGGGGSSSLNEGIAAFTAGRREVAVSALSKAAREDPKSPTPHIYLARMARDVQNYTLASQELQLALEADPNNALALREMGANLLQQGNNELARRFYVRAIQADPADKSSQGYLGCALMRLGRIQEATTFINRAGPGPWTGCTPATPQTQVPPGTAIPR